MAAHATCSCNTSERLTADRMIASLSLMLEEGLSYVVLFRLREKMTPNKAQDLATFKILSIDHDKKQIKFELVGEPLGKFSQAQLRSLLLTISSSCDRRYLWRYLHRQVL